MILAASAPLKLPSLEWDSARPPFLSPSAQFRSQAHKMLLRLGKRHQGANPEADHGQPDGRADSAVPVL